jgi:hypothetical protein
MGLPDREHMLLLLSMNVKRMAGDDYFAAQSIIYFFRLCSRPPLYASDHFAAEIRLNGVG